MRIFKEEQRFNQTWLIAIIIISTIMPIIIIVLDYLKDPESYSMDKLAGILGLILLASGIIFIFKLYTRIDDTGIYYKFFPFHWSYKKIDWNDLNEAYIRKYDAITEYGGWGLKGGLLWKKSSGKAINVSGDIGIQLEFKNGKRLLIGTQKKIDAENVINTYKHKIKDNESN